MTPAEFADVVVVPTVREHLAARGDRRLAYLACIATYSLVEYVGKAERAPNDVRDAVRKHGEAAYRIVQGIANGSKHAGYAGKFAFTPGQEVEVAQVRSGGEWGCRYGAEGLAVEHLGEGHFIDMCVQEVLARLIIAFPSHFPDFDFRWLDERHDLVSTAPSDLVFGRYEVGPGSPILRAKR